MILEEGGHSNCNTPGSWLDLRAGVRDLGHFIRNHLLRNTLKMTREKQLIIFIHFSSQLFLLTWFLQSSLLSLCVFSENISVRLRAVTTNWLAGPCVSCVMCYGQDRTTKCDENFLKPKHSHGWRVLNTSGALRTSCRPLSEAGPSLPSQEWAEMRCKPGSNTLGGRGGQLVRGK